MSIFKGSGVALITPFLDNKEVDYKSLDRIIDFQLENKTDAIIITGTTGEASTLDDDEHLDVIKHCVKRVDGKIPVIAGTGSNNTKHAIKMSCKAQDLGADGLLIVTPYYNKTTQEGLKVHYNAISSRVKIPILLYNVPSRTGCDIEPKTAVEIFKENENIIGIKEASGNIKKVQELNRLSKEKNITYDLYSGNDDDLLNMLNNNAKGVISVCANITPRRTHDIVYKYYDKDFYESKELFDEQVELSDILFSEVNPIVIKEACYQKGLIDYNDLRLPLININANNKDKLIKVLKKQCIIK